jgi:hypothetical protein
MQAEREQYKLEDFFTLTPVNSLKCRFSFFDIGSLKLSAESLPPDPDCPPYRADLRGSCRSNFGKIEGRISTEATPEFVIRTAPFHHFSAEVLYRFPDLPTSFFRWKRQIGQHLCKQVISLDFANSTVNSYLRGSVASRAYSVRLDAWPHKKRFELNLTGKHPRVTVALGGDANFAIVPTVEFHAFARSVGLNPGIVVYGGSLSRHIGVAGLWDWKGARVRVMCRCKEIGVKSEWLGAVAADWEVNEKVGMKAVLKSDMEAGFAARINVGKALKMRLSASVAKGIEPCFGGEFKIDGDELITRLREGRKWQ